MRKWPKPTSQYWYVFVSQTTLLVYLTSPHLPQRRIRNTQRQLMTSVMGTFFAAIGTTAFCLARGVNDAVAIHCGLSLMPIRMAYDAFVEKVIPPPPAIAMTAGLLSMGLFLPRSK